MANDGNVTVRPIDFIRDEAPLKSFLVERDRMRLDHLEPAVQAGDCFAMVAEEDGLAIGWAVVHTNFREDQDWSPPDEDTKRFQSGENAYLENIEVAAGIRGKGVGTALLEAIEHEAKKRGKQRLWLHTSENNVMAHKVFDRGGWTHETSVYPPWKPSSRTRVYTKEL
ncbi:MAG: GNAT family N-acetyltransferase [Dehalococcoidia bacterium]